MVPWSRFWERNYFADMAPLLHTVMENHFVRGAVSGLGLVNLWLAITDLGAVLQPGPTDEAAAGSDG
ncbi:MAG: hypothetical protein IT178_09790 [Acidobacteria bacterium]|nr:hypothetical protein [Acidobacteriota bacterium]